MLLLLAARLVALSVVVVVVVSSGHDGASGLGLLFDLEARHGFVVALHARTTASKRLARTGVAHTHTRNDQLQSQTQFWYLRVSD